MSFFPDIEWSLNCNSHCILFTVFPVLVIAISFYFFGPTITSKRKLLSDKEKDVVIVHYKTRGVPELSPFRLKLETYLKLANIPYKTDNKRQPSSKGKIPWIEYNGEIIEDSQFCIKYLNEKFQVNIDKNLTPEQVAIARAFQVMVEENTFWCLVLSRWTYEKKQPVFNCLSLSGIILWLVQRHQFKQAYQHGLGRHDWDTIKIITKRDLNALSEFLGKKPYLMGDEIHEVDCSIFGLLAQFYWYQKGSYGQTLMHECFPNLERYCERIKEKIWPNLTLFEADDITEK